METIQQLLTASELLIAGHPHRFLELEFYYCSPEHPDTFTHCHVDQQSFGKWCFHRAGPSPTSKYRNGTRKGLDISIGGPGVYGGILIRGLYDLTTKRVISGPCRVVDHILQLCGTTTIDTLVAQLGPCSTTGPILELRTVPTRTHTIQCKPRVGLSLKRPDEHKPRFLTAPYNFSVAP